VIQPNSSISHSLNIIMLLSDNSTRDKKLHLITTSREV
jgi:hypothetical protein